MQDPSKTMECVLMKAYKGEVGIFFSFKIEERFLMDHILVAGQSWTLASLHSFFLKPENFNKVNQDTHLEVIGLYHDQGGEEKLAAL